MLKILERKITLQLLVFYALFVIPLLLGGAEYRLVVQVSQPEVAFRSKVFHGFWTAFRTGVS